MTRTAWLLLALAPLACDDPTSPEATGDPSLPPPSDAPLQPGTPPFSGACELDEEDATVLLVTTTDFTTGAVTVVDAEGLLRPDVALGSTDAVPYPSPYGPVVVHRYTHDFVDVLDGDSWRSTAQHALQAADAVSPNPHAIAFDAEGLGYVTLLGSASMPVLDLSLPPGEALVDTIDLTPFADADGIPEASVAVRCGDTLWVGVQRLSPSWTPVDDDQLIAIDLRSRMPWDMDPEQPGGQGLPLLGNGLKQVRRVPGHPEALLGLTTGLERIDLAAVQTSWAVPPKAFAGLGVHHRLQLYAFDVHPDGTRAWVAAFLPPPGDEARCEADALACFGHAQLFEADLQTAALTPFGVPFEAKDRTVQHIGDTLWVGSSDVHAPGLYRYDLTTRPPSLLEGPLSTGLPPFSLTAIAP